MSKTKLTIELTFPTITNESFELGNYIEHLLTDYGAAVKRSIANAQLPEAEREAGAEVDPKAYSFYITGDCLVVSKAEEVS